MYVNYWPDLRNLGMACLARVLQHSIGCQGDLGGDVITTCPKKKKKKQDQLGEHSIAVI